MWPHLQENHFHYLLGVLITLLSWMWLRGELTPKWVLSLFQSEGEPSLRKVSALIMLLFTLCMQAKGRMPLGVIEANYTFMAVLFGLGTTKVVGKALAGRTPAPTVHTGKVENMEVGKQPE